MIGQQPPGNAKVDAGSTVTLTVSQGPGNATVPSVVGLSESAAKRTLTKAQLKFRTQQESSQSIAAGDATRTDPGDGRSVPVGHPGDAVHLDRQAAGDGPGRRRPVGRRRPRGAAQRRLHGDDDDDRDDIDARRPARWSARARRGDTSVPPGSTVNLVVAKAPTTAKVPDVTGDTARGATDELQAAGFKVTEQTKDVTKQNKDGIVISQDPGAGSTLNKGSTVTIVVGRFTSRRRPHRRPRPRPPPRRRRRTRRRRRPPRRRRPRREPRCASRCSAAAAPPSTTSRSPRPRRCARGCATAGHEVVGCRDRRATGCGARDGDELSLRARPRPARRRRRVPGAARAVRRGRHRPGPARVPRRALRRRRRAGLGAVHGQGPVQGPDGARGRPAGRLPRRSPRSTGAPSRERRSLALAALGLPVFVKPARLGSSVGIARVASAGGARRRRSTAAFEHDPLVIVEALATGLEVECSVLGQPTSRSPREPGEIVLADGESGWYDYEAKYTPGGMELVVPAADLRRRVRERVRELAVEHVRARAAAAGSPASTSSSTASRCSSTSSTRCPASPPTSVYAKLFEASGIAYPELLDAAACALALERARGQPSAATGGSRRTQRYSVTSSIASW